MLVVSQTADESRYQLFRDSVVPQLNVNPTFSFSLYPRQKFRLGEIEKNSALDESNIDLQATYNYLSLSALPGDRARAFQIWMTCVPVFVGSGSQLPSVERATRGLAVTASYPLQLTAYAELFARCKQFFTEQNELLAEHTTRLISLHAKGEMTTVAARAKVALSLGNDEEGLLLATAALGSNNPYEIFELAGLAGALLKVPISQIDQAESAMRDAAVVMGACQIGLDCSASSLVALKLCAFEGFCDGDGTDRLRSKFAGGLDSSMLDARVIKLVSDLKAGNIHTPEYFGAQVAGSYGVTKDKPASE